MYLFIHLLVYLGCLLEFNAVPSGQPYEGTHCLNLPVTNNETVFLRNVGKFETDGMG